MKLQKTCLLAGWTAWNGVGEWQLDKIQHMINSHVSTNHSTEGKLKVHFGMSRFFRSKPWKGNWFGGAEGIV
uniref:Uncharacterized protein n=1 Tax=Arundo donax TaxID=35708 RepID=A0A0A9D4Y4_ARUDO